MVQSHITASHSGGHIAREATLIHVSFSVCKTNRIWQLDITLGDLHLFVCANPASFTKENFSPKSKAQPLNQILKWIQKFQATCDGKQPKRVLPAWFHLLNATQLIPRNKRTHPKAVKPASKQLMSWTPEFELHLVAQLLWSKGEPFSATAICMFLHSAISCTFKKFFQKQPLSFKLKRENRINSSQRIVSKNA